MVKSSAARRRVPAEWALEVFCRGLRLDERELAGAGRPVEATRAGLGSGLEVTVGSGRSAVEVNAPVREGFAARSPLLLRAGVAGLEILDERDGGRVPAHLIPRPAWYADRTASGTEMGRIGRMQGSCLGIYVGGVCSFWKDGGTQRCGFCTSGRNLGAREAAEKSVRDVVETVARARRDGVTFVHLNTGYQGGEGLALLEPYVEAIQREVGALIGVQAVPPADPEEWGRYERLRALGADHFSFCVELEDPLRFAEVCPGKHAAVGQERFYEALAHCARLMPKGACSGEIIAGLEPLESTHRAIERITALGAFPTVCVFRPLPGARLADVPPPEPEALREVFRHVHLACRRRGIPMGLAPRVDTSLILTPFDCSQLVARDAAYWWWRARTALLRPLASMHFRRAMRAR